MQRTEERRSWNSSLAKRPGADVGAAAVSATLVAPAVTIIDRAIVEKSSLNQPLVCGLRKYAFAALRNPARFAFQLPFGIIWALYGVTYTVANGADTICHEFKASATGIIAFLSTTIVNVPMGVWKDIRFAQIFAENAATAAVTRPPLVQNRGVARAATLIFLLRDSVTIFGSFTLAPRLSEIIREDLATPLAKPVISQLTVPVLTQLVATPLHLLGLDLYVRQHAVPMTDRLMQSQRYLGSSIVVRCIRIIPAFGLGCLANMELRSLFHRNVNE